MTQVVAAATLELPPLLRRAGLLYHERVLASRNLAAKLQSTAQLVLECLDDLRLAVEASELDVVREFLSSVRRWTADLERECREAKEKNLVRMGLPPSSRCETVESGLNSKR